MSNFVILLTMLSVLGYGVSIKAAEHQSAPKPEDTQAITAQLSGTAWITNDLDASIKFYSEFLNFKIKKRIVLDSEAGTAVFGVSGKPLNYASLIPSNRKKEQRGLPDLNFVEIKGANPSSYSQNAERAAILGELVVAYSVKNLVEIERRMRIADVPVVVPLARSASGRSLALTVLDPNGIRIQMYEFGL